MLTCTLTDFSTRLVASRLQCLYRMGATRAGGVEAGGLSGAAVEGSGGGGGDGNGDGERERDRVSWGREGQAHFQLEADRVFYNPVQEFNRDLSIAVLRTYLANFKRNSTDISKVTLLEALSASGLRSMRYAKEIEGIDTIIANDISAKAVESIEANIELNKVGHIVKSSHDDATMIMYKNKGKNNRFTALDLDPYGCPSIFLDGAVQCVDDGGLLLVTATDMAVLAGNCPETCYSKYGSISLKSKACHENGLRILLQCIESHANRYGRYIEPLLSVSVDFYIRVFVRVFSGSNECKKTTSKLSMVYQCVGCDSFILQPLGIFKPNPTAKLPDNMKACLPHTPTVSPNCDHCGHKYHMGGPIWSGPLHNMAFVEKLLKLIQSEGDKFSTAKRMEGMLFMISEELNDIPLYYSMEKFSAVLHLQNIPMLIMRSAIMNGGYRVSYSHAYKMSVKTDAPAAFLWDIFRSWEKIHPVKKSRLVEGSPAQAILSKEIVTQVDFTERHDANPDSRKHGFLRFQYNPLPFWGPGTRSTARVGEDKMNRSRKNQNKNSIHKSKDFNLKRERSPETPIDDIKHLKVESDNT
ncbi:tRNA methyltransferase 1 isoform X2 [Arctopsyche grandis]|uniref:tRNA methyltransferase 1 isoform X2 n=1 Tax=Arctopsyche grandis TaxID=121162 RepID=UPI00406D6854